MKKSTCIITLNIFRSLHIFLSDCISCFVPTVFHGLRHYFKVRCPGVVLLPCRTYIIRGLNLNIALKITSVQKNERETDRQTKSIKDRDEFDAKLIISLIGSILSLSFLYRCCLLLFTLWNRIFASKMIRKVCSVVVIMREYISAIFDIDEELCWLVCIWASP